MDYEQQMAHYEKNYPYVYDLQFLQQNMFVLPVSSAKGHNHMLAHCKEMLEYNKGQFAIHPRHIKLIPFLRTAVKKGDGSLDKDATSFDSECR